MRVWGTGASIIVLVSLLSFGNPLITQASASPTRERWVHHISALHHAIASRPVAWKAHRSVTAVYHGVRTSIHRRIIASRWHHVVRRDDISCVPYARRVSGIDLSGNAWQWWDHAAGVYARGHIPAVGSVLAFRANPRMRLGHVAVVSRIVNRREVEIDQANWWGPGGDYGGVSRNVPVVDVSEANDWSAVRVGLGESGDFGAVYPTYGFIYDRPDTGVLVAAAHAPAPEPNLNPAPRDLRPLAERPWQTIEQVAEAPPVPIDPAPQPDALRSMSRGSGLVGTIDRK
jgi:hypothetical protein